MSAANPTPEELNDLFGGWWTAFNREATNTPDPTTQSGNPTPAELADVFGTWGHAAKINDVNSRKIDDPWQKALEKERNRIAVKQQDWEAQQKPKRAALQQALDAAKAERAKAYEDAHSELIVLADQMKAMQPNIGQRQVGEAYKALKARADALNGYINNLDTTFLSGPQNALDEYTSNAKVEYDAIFGPLQKNFDDAYTLADQLRQNSTQQQGFDAAYADASTRFANAVTQHDKDQAAYDMYVAKKNMYDQDSANRKADIDAGRYAVNPYQFMAQGATLGEIEDLRSQVNSGNLRPNMRVAPELVAPEEVKAPEGFKDTAPVHERVKDPTPSAEAAGILGWKAPDPKAAPPADPAAPTTSTTPTDTSSVTSQYKAPTPEDKVKGTGEAAAPAAPANNSSNEPQGASTLQATSSESGAANTTQTSAAQAPAAVAAAPAPALPAQPTGAVAGQANTTGQAPTEPTAPPVEEKPKPFAEDDGTKKEDHVW